MTFRMDDLPDSGRGPVETGEVLGIIKEVELGESQSTNREQLVVTFETEAGTKVKEFYQVDQAKPFLMFKLKCLIMASEMKITGDITLPMLAKMLPRGKQVVLILKENDRGYAELDYTKDNKGVEPYVFAQQGTPETAESLNAIAHPKEQEPKLDIASGDESFNKPAEDQTATPTVGFTVEDDDF